jgi:DNA repair protein RecO (recombination protein O)
MKRVSLEPAYVLHRRSYRETSFLVELFSVEYGRLTLIAKGARKAHSSTQGLLQPFIPLLISWVGKGELMTLTQVEMRGQVKYLQGQCLFAGLYLNELLMYLLQKWDAHPTLYIAYEKTLSMLQLEKLEEKTLRSFEKILLEELGYGLLPKSDISLHNTFVADRYYRFIPDQGFRVCEFGESFQTTGNIFAGKSLLAIGKENWQDEEVLKDAKRLIRLALALLLGQRSLNSRRLFMQPNEDE